MFVLVEVQDNVRVVPERFAEENLVIEEEINRKYANKVRCARSILHIIGHLRQPFLAADLGSDRTCHSAV